jgi:hypothetical protein
MLKKLLVCVSVVAFVNDLLCLDEEFRINYGLIGAVATYPFGGIVYNTRALELGANAVVHVVADVFLVREQ